MARPKKTAVAAEKETTKETAKVTEKIANAVEKVEEKVEEKKAAKKTAAKKTAAKKTTAKKAEAAPEVAPEAAPAAAPETKVNFFVEYGGVQVSVDEVIANVKATYGKDAKEISVYLQPGASKAYFVADGENGEMDVFFC